MRYTQVTIENTVDLCENETGCFETSQANAEIGLDERGDGLIYC